jgi:hypothetical protein
MPAWIVGYSLGTWIVAAVVAVQAVATPATIIATHRKLSIRDIVVTSPSKMGFSWTRRRSRAVGPGQEIEGVTLRYIRQGRGALSRHESLSQVGWRIQ